MKVLETGSVRESWASSYSYSKTSLNEWVDGNKFDCFRHSY